MYQPHRMKFGIFMAPFHRVGENPTLALKRDMKLIEHLDDLGYDEVWIGEHHSYARELIADPFIFIGAAAARTRRIKLGTRRHFAAVPPPADDGRPRSSSSTT